MLLPCFGCVSAPQRTGSAAIETFLSLMAAGDYQGAYALLAASSRNDTDTPKTNRVTEQEFINRYTNIFDALAITSVEYKNLAVSSGTILCKATFDAVYTSELVGEMENSFSLAAFWAGGFVNAWPGIVLQLILVPLVISALERAKLIPLK